MNAGRLSKRNEAVNVLLSGNLIKQHLGLELSPWKSRPSKRNIEIRGKVIWHIVAASRR